MELLLVGLPGPWFDWARNALGEAVPHTHLLPPGAAQSRVIACIAPPDPGLSVRDGCALLYALADLRGASVFWLDQTTKPADFSRFCGLDPAHLPPLPSVRAENPHLAPALAWARQAERRPQIWPRSLLLDADHPDQPLPKLIALTGPARNLAYGPYIGFSSGPARLDILLAVSANCHRAEMAIELHGQTMLGRGLFTLTRPGLFTATITVHIPSARDALEIRLKLERGAIEGEIGVDQARLAPVDSPA